MSKKRKKESGEPTWVYHKTLGPLPDECPLFGDIRAGTNPMVHPTWDLVQLVAFEGRVFPVDGIPISGPYQLGAWSADYWGLVPLTTAARELLAAFKAERGE